MARTNKCDRCGTLYERRTINDEYRIQKRLPYEAENVDLCSECQEAFEKFMKSCEKEREKINDSRFWKS